MADDEQNFGDDVLRIAREQNVSQASALRAAAITSRYERRRRNRRIKGEEFIDE